MIGAQLFSFSARKAFVVELLAKTSPFGISKASSRVIKSCSSLSVVIQELFWIFLSISLFIRFYRPDVSRSPLVLSNLRLDFCGWIIAVFFLVFQNFFRVVLSVSLGEKSADDFSFGTLSVILLIICGYFFLVAPSVLSHSRFNLLCVFNSILPALVFVASNIRARILPRLFSVNWIRQIPLLFRLLPRRATRLALAPVSIWTRFSFLEFMERLYFPTRATSFFGYTFHINTSSVGRVPGRSRVAGTFI